MNPLTGRISGIFLITFLFSSALTFSCAPDFEKFTTVSKLRVLGVAAEPPALRTGETALFSALVASPKNSDVAYRWSWCPLSTGSLTGYRCAIEETAFRAAIAAIAPGVENPFPPYDLGTEETTSFLYGLDSDMLQQLCKLALSQSKPGFVLLPSCDTDLRASITLEVTAGDETVTVVKELALMLDKEVAPNQNPTIGDIAITDKDGNTRPVEPGEITVVSAGAEYELFIDVPETATEEFTPSPTAEISNPKPEREGLFLTWFVEQGSYEFNRTGYLNGDTDFEKIRVNTWKSPNREDGAEPFSLYWVLQDQRGGAVWTKRQFIVEEAN